MRQDGEGEWVDVYTTCLWSHKNAITCLESARAYIHRHNMHTPHTPERERENTERENTEREGEREKEYRERIQRKRK